MSNLTMMRKTFSFLALLACLMTCLVSHASAQDTDKRVMILKFDTLDVDTELMDTFYTELNERVEAHAQKTVVTGGDVSINEMILTVGCEDGPTPECLGQLQDFVDADQLLFGSVQRSEDVHLFTVRLFDFGTQSFEASIEDQTVDGDLDRVRTVIPALIDGLLYGDVGRLNIKISGQESYDIFLDGELIGKSSAQIDALPLGEHVVMVRSTSGEEQTQQVILTRDDAANLTFVFDGGAGSGETSGGGNKLLVPGVAAAIAGVVGIGFGTYQYMGYRSDANWLNDNTICASNAGLDAASPDCDQAAFKDASAAQEYNTTFDKDFEKQRTRAIIGWSVGGALTAIGGALIYMGNKNSREASTSLTAPEKRSGIKVQWVGSPGYQGLQLQGRF